MWEGREGRGVYKEERKKEKVGKRKMAWQHIPTKFNASSSSSSPVPGSKKCLERRHVRRQISPESTKKREGEVESGRFVCQKPSIRSTLLLGKRFSFSSFRHSFFHLLMGSFVISCPAPQRRKSMFPLTTKKKMGEYWARELDLF